MHNLTTFSHSKIEVTKMGKNKSTKSDGVKPDGSITERQTKNQKRMPKGAFQSRQGTK